MGTSPSPSSAGLSARELAEKRREEKSQSRIKVFVRCRPSFEGELGGDDEAYHCVEMNTSDNFISVQRPYDTKRFDFDSVFDTNVTQEHVFETVGRPTIGDVFNGYHGTIFVYGQTGTGKTHTISCSEDGNEGLIQRAVRHIFAKAEKESEEYEYSFSVQCVQIYMEMIQDLLNPEEENLQIRDDPESGMFLKGVCDQVVHNPEELFEYYNIGVTNRVTALTKMNASSSRSHVCLIISLQKRTRIKITDMQGGPKNVTNRKLLKGKLYLVDLAGSERLKKTGATGTRREESKYINLSLTNLGLVIHALEVGKTHAPFRDSKLTRLLQDSLGGHGKTSIVVTIGPSSRHLQETISSLQFGSRAMKVKTRAKVFESVDYKAVSARLKSQIEELETRQEETDRELLDLMDENDNLLKKIDVKESELQEMNQRITSILSDSESEKSTLLEMLEENMKIMDSDHQGKMEEMQKEMEKLREKQSNALESVEDEHLSQIYEMTNELESKKEEVMRLEEELTEVRSNLMEREGELEMLLERDTKNEEDINSQRSKLHEMEHQYESELNLAREHIEAYEHEVKNCREQIADLEAKMHENGREYGSKLEVIQQTHHQEMTQAKEEHDKALMQQSKEHEEELLTMKDRFSLAEEQLIQRHQEEISSLRSELEVEKLEQEKSMELEIKNACQRDINNARQEMKNMQGQMEQVVAERNAHEQEKLELEKQLTNEQQSIQRMKEHMEHLLSSASPSSRDAKSETSQPEPQQVYDEGIESDTTCEKQQDLDKGENRDAIDAVGQQSFVKVDQDGNKGKVHVKQYIQPEIQGEMAIRSTHDSELEDNIEGTENIRSDYSIIESMTKGLSDTISQLRGHIVTLEKQLGMAENTITEKNTAIENRVLEITELKQSIIAVYKTLANIAEQHTDTPHMKEMMAVGGSIANIYQEASQDLTAADTNTLFNRLMTETEKQLDTEERTNQNDEELEETQEWISVVEELLSMKPEHVELESITDDTAVDILSGSESYSLDQIKKISDQLAKSEDDHAQMLDVVFNEHTSTMLSQTAAYFAGSQLTAEDVIHSFQKEDSSSIDPLPLFEGYIGEKFSADNLTTKALATVSTMESTVWDNATERVLDFVMVQADDMRDSVNKNGFSSLVKSMDLQKILFRDWILMASFIMRAQSAIIQTSGKRFRTVVDILKFCVMRATQLKRKVRLLNRTVRVISDEYHSFKSTTLDHEKRDAAARDIQRTYRNIKARTILESNRHAQMQLQRENEFRQQQIQRLSKTNTRVQKDLNESTAKTGVMLIRKSVVEIDQIFKFWINYFTREETTLATSGSGATGVASASNSSGPSSRSGMTVPHRTGRVKRSGTVVARSSGNVSIPSTEFGRSSFSSGAGGRYFGAMDSHPNTSSSFEPSLDSDTLSDSSTTGSKAPGTPTWRSSKVFGNHMKQ